MKISGVNNNIINLYSNNKRNISSKVENKKNDYAEISQLGKSLTSFALESNNINSSEKVEKIRNQVMNGTYNIDVTLTAKSMMNAMKGREI